MPAGDGRGPVGSGSMTGRGAGYCAGYSVPGYANTVRGGGYSGFGKSRVCRGWKNRFFTTGGPLRGRGFNNGYEYPYPQNEFSAETEAKMLKEQAEFMRKNIEVLNERVRQLEALTAGKQE